VLVVYGVKGLYKLNNSDYLELLDHTEDCKGKTFHITNALLRGDPDYFGLEMNVGWKTPFDITLQLPPGVKHPNIQKWQKFDITFVCKEGSLRRGNEIISIERAD